MNISLKSVKPLLVVATLGLMLSMLSSGCNKPEPPPAADPKGAVGGDPKMINPTNSIAPINAKKRNK